MTSGTLKLPNENYEREANVFCRYLIGVTPNEYVVAHYRRAHEVGALCLDERASRFDELLVRIARIAPALTRLADAYASVCDGRRLRSKLVLLLGILENSPAHFDRLNAPAQQTRVAFFAGACAMMAAHFAHVLTGLLVFLPIRTACWLRGNHESTSA